MVEFNNLWSIFIIFCFKTHLPRWLHSRNQNHMIKIKSFLTGVEIVLAQSRIILNLIAENENIKEQIKRAGEAIADWQMALESEINHEKGFPMEVLSDKQWKLVQAIGFLEDGLSSHYQRAQKEIVSFVGLLGEALEIEHTEIQEQLRRIRQLLTVINLKNSSGIELAAKYNDVKRELEITYRLIHDDSLAEDYILTLLLKATKHNEGNKENL
jgi:hypothetical protein